MSKETTETETRNPVGLKDDELKAVKGGGTGLPVGARSAGPRRDADGYTITAEQPAFART